MKKSDRVVDILRLPVVGALLRSRWGRLCLQAPLLLLAALVVYDGFTGPQLAPTNLATVTIWIHYRGLVVLALLLVGSLFCMGCPFALLRTVGVRLAGRGRRWPRRLRNKWGAVVLLFVIFWLYEWLDLWASPELTVVLALAYFAAAIALEAIFRESPFCKYLCPLGAFNMHHATVAPFQIRARDRQLCRSCANKECVNGDGQILGCGMELYVPQIAGNLDCLLCLDCARACPHNNVTLAARGPGEELALAASPGRKGLSLWRGRWDVAFLGLMLAFAGVSNAFGMVPPVYELERALAGWLGTESDGLVLLLIFGAGNLALPAGLAMAAAAASRRLTGSTDPLRQIATCYAPAVMPLSLSIWTAHYLFHFATGALSIVPVIQNFALDHGVSTLGSAPRWELGAILPAAWLLPIQVGVVLAGLMGSLSALGAIGRNTRLPSRAVLPWLLLFLILAVTAVTIFTMPMEMRGTVQFAH